MEHLRLWLVCSWCQISDLQPSCSTFKKEGVKCNMNGRTPPPTLHCAINCSSVPEALHYEICELQWHA